MDFQDEQDRTIGSSLSHFHLFVERRSRMASPLYMRRLKAYATIFVHLLARRGRLGARAAVGGFAPKPPEIRAAAVAACSE